MINEALDYHMNMNHVVFNRERIQAGYEGWSQEFDKSQGDMIIEATIRQKISDTMTSIQKLIQATSYPTTLQSPPVKIAEPQRGFGRKLKGGARIDVNIDGERRFQINDDFGPSKKFNIRRLLNSGRKNFTERAAEIVKKIIDDEPEEKRTIGNIERLLNQIFIATNPSEKAYIDNLIEDILDVPAIDDYPISESDEYLETYGEEKATQTFPKLEIIQGPSVVIKGTPPEAKQEETLEEKPEYKGELFSLINRVSSRVGNVASNVGRLLPNEPEFEMPPEQGVRFPSNLGLASGTQQGDITGSEYSVPTTGPKASIIVKMKNAIFDSLSGIVSSYNGLVDYIDLQNRQKPFKQKDISTIDGLVKQLVDPLKSALAASSNIRRLVDERGEVDASAEADYTRVYNVLSTMIKNILTGLPFIKVDSRLISEKVPLRKDYTGEYSQAYISKVVKNITKEIRNVNMMPEYTELEREAKQIYKDSLNDELSKLVNSNVITDETARQLVYGVQQEVATNKIDNTTIKKLERVELSLDRLIPKVRDFADNIANRATGAPEAIYNNASRFIDKLLEKINTLPQASANLALSIKDTTSNIAPSLYNALTDLLVGLKYPMSLIEDIVSSISKLYKSGPAKYTVGPTLALLLMLGVSFITPKQQLTNELDLIQDNMAMSFQAIPTQAPISTTMPTGLPSAQASRFKTIVQPFSSYSLEDQEEYNDILKQIILNPRDKTSFRNLTKDLPKVVKKEMAELIRDYVKGLIDFDFSNELEVGQFEELEYATPSAAPSTYPTLLEDIKGKGKPHKKGGNVHKTEKFGDEAELEPYLTKHLRPSKYRKDVPPIESSSEESSGEEGSGSDMEINDMRLGKGKSERKARKQKEDVKAIANLPKAEAMVLIEKKRGGAKKKTEKAKVKPALQNDKADIDLWFM